MPNPAPVKIAVFGSINIDITGFSERLPKPGETVPGRRSSIALGGKGANQASAVARLGASSAMIGRVGDDSFGALARERLRGLGVGLDHVLTTPAVETGIAIITVDANAENCIVVIGGANAHADDELVAHAKPALSAARALLLQIEVPLAASLAAAQVARAAGGLVVFDPAPAPPGGLPDKMWRTVDIVTPNETETEALIGLRPDSPDSGAAAAAKLVARGAPMAVVKMGAHGVCFHGPAGKGFVPPFAVKAVNSVGAGDCFNAGLAVALARGQALPDAVRFAAACGALATTGAGGAEAAPTLAAVEALLAR